MSKKRRYKDKQKQIMYEKALQLTSVSFKDEIGDSASAIFKKDKMNANLSTVKFEIENTTDEKLQYSLFEHNLPYTVYEFVNPEICDDLKELKMSVMSYLNEIDFFRIIILPKDIKDITNVIRYNCMEGNPLIKYRNNAKMDFVDAPPFIDPFGRKADFLECRINLRMEDESELFLTIPEHSTVYVFLENSKYKNRKSFK
jgi:hypothetical protein